MAELVGRCEDGPGLKATDTVKREAGGVVDEDNRNGGKDNIAIVLVEPQISEVKL